MPPTFHRALRREAAELVGALPGQDVRTAQTVWIAAIDGMGRVRGDRAGRACRAHLAAESLS